MRDVGGGDSTSIGADYFVYGTPNAVDVLGLPSVVILQVSEE